ncbi:inverse autotransporter beta domain-containing protein [Parachlamydia sp.]|jgi:hypothetical protein|uniref:inverse autotransporter beta domain-containing protein n=1 Tax=Parachlamydia sp. TaxID=2052048 RepID=UPI003D0C0E20
MKKNSFKNASLFFCFFLCLLANLFASPEKVVENEVSLPSLNDVQANEWVFPPTLAYLQGVVGKGIGEQNGYASFGIFTIPLLDSNGQLFFDARIHNLRHERWAANVGVGTRIAIPCTNLFFGINFFYDYRRTRHDYHQLGPGLELIHPCWAFRINGYFPICDRSLRKHPKVFRFHDNLFAACTQIQNSLSGGDLELETSLRRWDPCLCFDVYIAPGGYFYHIRHHRDITGGRLRIGAVLFDYLGLEVRGSYDHYYKGTVQGVAYVEIPFGGPRCSSPCDTPPFLWPVQRQEIIVLDKKYCRWRQNF